MITYGFDNPTRRKWIEMEINHGEFIKLSLLWYMKMFKNWLIINRPQYNRNDKTPDSCLDNYTHLYLYCNKICYLIPKFLTSENSYLEISMEFICAKISFIKIASYSKMHRFWYLIKEIVLNLIFYSSKMNWRSIYKSSR